MQNVAIPFDLLQKIPFRLSQNFMKNGAKMESELNNNPNQEKKGPWISQWSKRRSRLVGGGAIWRRRVSTNDREDRRLRRAHVITHAMRPEGPSNSSMHIHVYTYIYIYIDIYIIYII